MLEWTPPWPDRDHLTASAGIATYGSTRGIPCWVMLYRFAQERVDYSDFASGRVFRSLPGRTAFPVRLADELFQRCLSLRPPDQRATPVTLYDPCCGGATLLCTLAILHWASIRQIVAS